MSAQEQLKHKTPAPNEPDSDGPDLELVSRLAQISDLSHGGPDLEHLDDSYIRKLLNQMSKLVEQRVRTEKASICLQADKLASYRFIQGFLLGM